MAPCGAGAPGSHITKQQKNADGTTRRARVVFDPRRVIGEWLALAALTPDPATRARLQRLATQLAEDQWSQTGVEPPTTTMTFERS